MIGTIIIGVIGYSASLFYAFGVMVFLYKIASRPHHLDDDKDLINLGLSFLQCILIAAFTRWLTS